MGQALYDLDPELLNSFGVVPQRTAEDVNLIVPQSPHLPTIDVRDLSPAQRDAAIQLLNSRYVTMDDLTFHSLTVPVRLALMKSAYSTLQLQMAEDPAHPFLAYEYALLPKPAHENPDARTMIAIPLPSVVKRGWGKYCPTALIESRISDTGLNHAPCNGGSDVNGRAAGMGTTLSPTRPSNNRNLHGRVPWGIRELCRDNEIEAFDRKYGPPIEGVNQWPLMPFLLDYPAIGQQPAVTTWVGRRRREVVEGWTTDDAEVEEVRRPARVPPQETTSMRGQYNKHPNWIAYEDDVVAGTYQPVHSLRELFTTVTEENANRWKKSFASYDPRSPDASIRDYCAWISANRFHLMVLGRPFDNFCLLMLSPPNASSETIRTLGRRVTTIAFENLAATMGRIVYRNLSLNPIAVASNLRIGFDRCYDCRTLYYRVVDLHYCRNVQADLHKFCSDVMFAVAFHLPCAVRDRFYDNVLNVYPTILTVGQLISVEDDFIDAPSVSPNQRELPCTPCEVRQFCIWLVKVACQPVPRVEERRHADLLAGRRGDLSSTHGWLDEIEANRRVVQPITRRVQAALEAQPVLEIMDEESQKTQIDSERKPRDKCTFCQKVGHVVDRCWEKYPDQIPAGVVNRRNRAARANESKKGNKRAANSRGDGPNKRVNGGTEGETRVVASVESPDIDEGMDGADSIVTKSEAAPGDPFQ